MSDSSDVTLLLQERDDFTDLVGFQDFLRVRFVDHETLGGVRLDEFAP